MAEAAVEAPDRALRLSLLGQFRATRDGQEIPDDAWKRRKTRALVKALAVTPSHRLHREQLQEALWPDLDPSAGDRSLRKALHHARHLLEPELVRGEGSRYLRLSGEMLILDVDHVWIDADQFEQSAQQALASGHTWALESAAALYTGDLLPEDMYEEWTIERRASLVELRSQVLLRLADGYEHEGRSADASGVLQQMLIHDPAREEVHRRIMRLYAAAGSRHQALRQYQTLLAALAEEYDATPDEETEALHAEIRAGRIAPVTARLEGQLVIASPPILRDRHAVPMVGRERPFEMLLADLQSHSSESDGRTPPLILVSGEAGVGKTRLLSELARTALDRGMLVLWGSSYETEGSLSYGTFIDAMNTAIGALSEPQRRALAAEQPELARLLPVLGPVQLLQSFDPGSEQPRLFAAVARLLTQLAAAQPLLLVLDDLHAADAVSLHLLHHLTRLASGQRWLIAGAYRDESVLAGGELQTMLTALHRSGLARHMDLLRLARADCDRLVGSVLGNSEIDPSALKYIYELSMGNPLFAGELVQAMRETGEMVLDAGRWTVRGDRRASQPKPVPQQIRELVEARVHALGDRAEQALMLAATAGMEVSFSVLAAAAQTAFPDSLQEHALLDALDAALTARILEERGDAYTFRHPLFREALYSRLSANRRRRLHLSIARAMESEQPGEAERLAHHYTQGGDQKNAVLYLRRAGERSEDLHAYAAAEAHYCGLLDFVAGSRSADEAFALEHLGTVIYFGGNNDQALTYLEPAAALYEASGDLEGVARVEQWIALALRTRGDRGAALARYREIIDRIERQECMVEALPLLYVELGNTLFYSGRYDDALQCAEHGAQLAHDAGDLRTYAWAQSRLGLGLQMIGRVAESGVVLQRCIPMLDEVRDARALTLALNNLGVVHELHGNSLQAIADRRRALQIAERGGDPWLVAAMRALLASTLLDAGEWDESRSLLERSREILRVIDVPATELLRRCYVGQLEYLEGNWQTAAAHLREVEEGAAQINDIQFQRMAALLLAEIDVREGRAEEAVRRLEPLLDRPGMEEPVVAVLLSLVAVARLELGDVDRAEEMSLRALSRCESRKYLGLLAPCLLNRGTICSRQGRWEEAETAYSRAAAVAHSLPNPILEGRCLVEWSAVLDRQGKTEAADEQRAAALAIFARLGARREMESISG